MLAQLWGGKQKKVLGLDIGASAVRLVEMSRNGAGYRLDRFAVEKMPLNAMSENEIKDVNAVAAAVRRAYLRSGSKLQDSAVAVSSSQIISKNITMPAGFSESELEEQIKVEAGQYIPYSTDEVNMDFIVEESATEDSDTLQIQLVASRSENVDARIAVLEQAGVRPKIVDVEMFALENAFPLACSRIGHAAQVNTVALINVGDVTTTLVVVRDGKGIYNRDQMFGDVQLTEAIQNHYGLTFEQADEARQTNKLPEDFEQEVLPGFCRAVAQQCSRLLQLFFSASGVSHVDHVVLSGECAKLPGIADRVAEVCGITVSIANPFTTLSMGSGVAAADFEKEAPALMVACGLALRSFDQ